MRSLRLLCTCLFALLGFFQTASAQLPCPAPTASSDYGFTQFFHNSQNATNTPILIFTPGAVQNITLEYFNNSGSPVFLEVVLDLNGNGIPDYPSESIYSQVSFGSALVDSFQYLAPLSSGYNYSMQWWAILDDGPIDQPTCVSSNGERNPVEIYRVVHETSPVNSGINIFTSSWPDPTLFPAPINPFPHCFYSSPNYGLEVSYALMIQSGVLSPSSLDVSLHASIYQVFVGSNGTEYIGVELDGGSPPFPNHITTLGTLNAGMGSAFDIEFQIPFYGLPSEPSSNIYTGNAQPYNTTLVMDYWLENSAGALLPLFDINSGSPLQGGIASINLYECEWGASNRRSDTTQESNFSYGIFPNPTREQFQVEFAIDSDQELEVYLINASGQKVSVIFMGLCHEGINKWKVDVSSLSSGIYNLMIRTKNTFKSQKIMVK